MPRKVMVSGCFDLLHSGHIAFFKEASAYGDLYVALGSDKTVFDLKGRLPINSEDERLFMVKSVSFVKDAFISRGSGLLDFIHEFEELKPDVFVVNEDGHTPDKQTPLRIARGRVHRAHPRTAHRPGAAFHHSAAGRSTGSRSALTWQAAGLDQPFVSQHHPGSVVTISIEPTLEFNERSGMASSTRNAAIELWATRLPAGDLEKTAKVLFCYDNPPGTKEISGSQDAIGIVFPGLAKAYYEGGYWPSTIERIRDEGSLHFVESALYLITLGPRHNDFDVLSNTHIDRVKAKALADAAEDCWQAIIHRDISALARRSSDPLKRRSACSPIWSTRRSST